MKQRFLVCTVVLLASGAWQCAHLGPLHQSNVRQRVAIGEGNVVGHISTGSPEIPVVGAVVQLTDDSSRITASDQTGDFIFTSIPPGRYSLSISHPEYQERFFEDVIVKASLTTELRTVLQLTNPENFGQISGSIFDSVANETIVGAVVTVENTMLSTRSDLRGKFMLQQVPVGIHSLTVTHPEFLTQTIDSVFVRSEQTTRVDCYPQPKPRRQD